MSDVLIVAPFAAGIADRLGVLDGGLLPGGVLPGGVRIRTAESFDAPDPDPARVTVLVAIPEMLEQPIIDRFPRLEWLQTITSGVDPLLGLDLRGIAVSNAAGVHAPQMTELAFLYMLAFARDVRGLLARQAAAQWLRRPQRLLAGAQAVIVGVGRIAEVLAQRCRSFDMRVTGVTGSRREAPGFDRLVGRDRLVEAARTADYLIVIAPYSPRTHHLVSREVIDALPPTAVLINIARGAVVDESALIDALTQQRIAGAGLDVFATEPLPADHILWTLPNVILTPHIGGVSANLVEQVTPLIEENLRRWFASPRRPLVNAVERL
jgi:phosphoglycerate dehydrogenase-like enzyme